MRGKQNILITGANGYLGAHITENLARAGHSIYALCLDVFPEQKGWEDLGIQTIQGDITKTECLEQLEALEIDSIVHLVSLNHFDSEKDPEFVYKVNVLPTWNLLKRFSPLGLKRFIYFSTQQVYGRIGAIEVDESYPPAPVNTYGLTHLQSEQLVELFDRNTDIEGINIRLSNSYGAPLFKQNSCWWLVVNDLCRSAYQNQYIKLLSDGSPQRDFIHVSDVAEAVKVLLEGDIKSKRYHISSGKTYTILELARLVQAEYKRRYQKHIPIINKEEQESPEDPKPMSSRYVIDNSALLAEGMTFHTGLSEGIDSIFEYLEKN